MGIRIQARAFQGTRSPAFPLLSSFLAAPKFAEQVCRLLPAVEMSSQDNREGPSPGSSKGKGKDGESTNKRNQYLLSSFYMPSTVWLNVPCRLHNPGRKGLLYCH